MNDYYTESEGEMPKKKRKAVQRENQRTTEFIKMMRKQGATQATRLPDDSNKHWDYDSFVPYRGFFMPIEWKKKQMARTINISHWRRDQGHQWDALEHFYKQGFHPFFGIHWQPTSRGKWEYRVMPWHMLKPGKMDLLDFHPIEHIDQLVLLCVKHFQGVNNGIV